MFSIAVTSVKLRILHKIYIFQSLLLIFISEKLARDYMSALSQYPRILTPRIILVCKALFDARVGLAQMTITRSPTRLQQRVAIITDSLCVIATPFILGKSKSRIVESDSCVLQGLYLTNSNLTYQPRIMNSSLKYSINKYKIRKIKN